LNLGLQELWTGSIPPLKSHFKEVGVNIFHLCAGLPSEWSVCSFLFHSVSPNYKAYNYWKSLHSTFPANPHLLILVTFPTVVPSLFSPAYPSAAYFRNCTLHISKMFVIDIVTVISNLSCLTLLTYVPFSAIIKFFSCTPKCPGLYPWGYAYPRLGITALPHLVTTMFYYRL
jgi:hypothetical protein